MYKQILMLMVTAVLILGVVQSALAFQVPDTHKSGVSPGIFHGNARSGLLILNQTAADLRLQRAKTSAINGIDARIRALNADKNAVGRSRLTDDQKAALTSQVASNITWFESRKSNIQSSNDMAGVLQNARQAADRWDQINPAIKKEIGLMICDNLDTTLGDARRASDVAAGKIESLKTRGNATGGLEKALASYNGHVDNATADVNAARSEFDSIGAPNDRHFLAGLMQIEMAQNDLKSSYGDLKTIYRLLYRSNVSGP